MLVASSCLLASFFSLDLIALRSHYQSDSVSLPPGTGINVAVLEFQQGEEVEYSFEASDMVRLEILAKSVDVAIPPLVVMQSVTATSYNDRFVAEHEVCRFIFTNPSETSDVEVTYTIVHQLPYLIAIPMMVLLILAVLTLSYAIRYLVFYRRWLIGPVSPEQRRLNNLPERRRTDSKSIWLRH